MAICNHFIRLEIRNLKLDYATAAARDSDYARIVKFLKDRGVTTANASVSKRNITSSVFDREIVVPVSEAEALPRESI